MKIDSNTRLYAVLGDPVSQSLSPVMHNSAFAHTGYNGVYIAFRATDIAGAVNGIRALGIQGASITTPHKIAILDYLDDVHENTKEIGAVNTVINRHGKLFGSNTDGRGAVKALIEKTPLQKKEIGIIGAGGAARAIGFAALSQGASVTIFNRSKHKGEILARDLGARCHSLSELNQVNCHVLINATPVGMFPETSETPAPKDIFRRGMTVMDIVYNPLKTRFLKEAETMGCSIVDGVNMFVYQGALQFELWTGKKAPIHVMRQAVMEASSVQS